MSISNRALTSRAAGSRALFSWFLSVISLVVLSLLVSCSDGRDGPVEPGKKGPAELVITVRFDGDPAVAAVSRLRVQVEDPATGRTLGALERALAPGEAGQPVTLLVTLEQPLSARATVELLGAEGRVEWSGRGSVTLQPGIRSTQTLDLYRGPLTNLDITQLAIMRPTGAVAEGDTLRLTAQVTGASGTPVLYWSTPDTAVATLASDGLLRAKQPGTVRVKVMAGAKSDTATLTIGARITRVEITPDTLRLSSVGEEASALARALDVRGGVVAGAGLTWTVADTTVAVSLGDGRIRAVANGQTTLTVRSANDPSLQTSATVVVAQRVATVSVSPGEAVLGAIGETKAFQVSVSDANGHAIEGRPVLWSSANPAVASISAEGVATAAGNGTTTLTATVDGVSGSTRLSVRQTVHALRITPESLHFGALDEAAPLSAVAFDAQGNVVADAVFTWSSSDPGVAEVSIQGVVVAVGNGAARITARVGEVTGTADVLVEQSIALLALTPKASTLAAVGEMVKLSAAARDANGYAVTGVAFTWSSLDPVVATVNASGTVTAVANGTARIRVAADDRADTALITVAQVPAAITVVAGEGQTEMVATLLPISPAVRVTDARGAPVPGVGVSFTASGNGSVIGSPAMTDAAGVATVGSWTLATATGANTLTATAGALSTTISATGTGGAPANIAKSAGDAQTAMVGAAVGTAPAVTITDQYGNPVPGVSVSFAVSGDGSVTGSPTTTDASGVATVGSWTLASTVGANTLTVSAGALNTTFSATGTVGAPANISRNAGDGQIATVGTAALVAPSVTITDQYGNPVAGVSVSFAPSGNGSVTGSPATTDASGVATVGSWTLSTTVGTNTLTATVDALSTSFTATALVGAPANIAKSTGDTQTAMVGAVVPTTPAVMITDQYGNPVAGVSVSFAASGDGSVTGSPATTDVSGVATAGSWTLGTTAGANTLTASVGALSTSFTATALVGAPANIAKSAGDAQTATVGAAVGTAPAVTITDQYGNPVAGVSVSFAASGDGSVTGSPATTDASGVATVGSWTLSTTVGANTLTASAGAFSTSFAATGIAGPPAQLSITTQPASTAQAGITLPQQPVIQLLDAYGNPVSQTGASITAAIASGGGTLGGTTTVTTDASGVAIFADLGIGGTVGDRTLSFSTSGLTGATSNTIHLTAGTAEALAFSAQPSNAVASAPITPAVQVSVVDAYGNLVGGATDNVVLAIGTNPSGGTLSGTTSVAATGGVATFANLSIDLVGTAYTLSASSGTLTGATSAGFDVTHGPLDHFLVEAAGGGAIGVQQAGAPFDVRVTAQDAYNNTVTSFTGTVGLTSTPSGAISAGATSGAFTAGVLASHSITFGTSGNFTLTATRTSGMESGKSNSFDVQAPPTAVNEGPAAGSSPGQPFHAFYSTSGSPQTFTLPAPGVLANDNRGFPAATITSFGADSMGGSVADHAAGSILSPLPGSGRTTGSLSVAADGTVTFTPPDGFTGNYVFRYRLSNARGTSDARVTIAVGARPEAVNDTYSPVLVGNVPINTATSTRFRVTTNDLGDGKKLAVTSQSNGTATLNADSTFTFRPTPGYEGPASFTYTITNGFGTSAQATVSMTVANPIWFVDVSAGAGGDGRYDAPFNSLPSFTTINNGTENNPADGDRIFLYTGSYTGEVTLRANQSLIGQGATESLSSIAGVTWPADAGPEPVMGGVAPTITTAVASTNGITLGSGNTLRGFNLGNVTGSALSGTGFGTLTVSEVEINTTGQALDLTNGTLSGSFPVLRSAGGTNNIYLSGVATSSPVVLGSSSDALSGASSDALRIDGGTGSFTYPGSISNVALRAVNITNKAGGAVVLSGDINPGAAGRGIVATNNNGTTLTFSGRQRINASQGVSLTNNPASTVTFSADSLQVTTTGGDGFVVTNSGTLRMTGVGHTISSTNGAALRVENTEIGAGGLKFKRIDANGGSNGIVLDNTGASGGLTITGDGVTPGSGGTIRNTAGLDLAVAGNGIYLSSTRDVVLNWMKLNDHPNHAIRGSSVRNFTLHRTQITGVNGTNSAGGYNEGSISFDNLTGQASFSNSYIGGGFTDNVRVVTGAGTLDRIVFTNDTIAHNSTSDGNDGILLESQNTATINATITDNVFHGARGDMFQFALQSASRGDLVLERNTFHNTHPNTVSGGGGVTVGGGGGATASAALTYRIENNSFQGALGSALVVSKYGGVGVHSGTIRNNVIGVAGNTSLGSEQGSALFVGHTGGGTHTTLVEGNSVYGYNNSGISLQAGDASAGGGSGAFNITIRNNTIANPGPFASYGVMLNAGTTSVDAHQICLDLGGVGASANLITGTGATSDVYLRQRQNTAVRLPGYAGVNSDNPAVISFVANRNNRGGVPSVNAVNNVAEGGGGFINGPSCAQP